METYHTFKNVENFQAFLRSGKYPSCHSSGCLDYVRVGGVLYTMHEFDLYGHSVNWANKRKNKMIEMTTADRYNLGYEDAEVIEYEPGYLRNDIAYAQ